MNIKEWEQYSLEAKEILKQLYFDSSNTLPGNFNTIMIGSFAHSLYERDVKKELIRKKEIGEKI